MDYSGEIVVVYCYKGATGSNAIPKYIGTVAKITDSGEFLVEKADGAFETVPCVLIKRIKGVVNLHEESV